MAGVATCYCTPVIVLVMLDLEVQLSQELVPVVWGETLGCLLEVELMVQEATLHFKVGGVGRGALAAHPVTT